MANASGYFRSFLYSSEFNNSILYMDSSSDTTYSGAYVARNVNVAASSGGGMYGISDGQTIILDQNSSVSSFYQTLELTGKNATVTLEEGSIVRSFISAAINLYNDGAVLTNKGTVLGGHLEQTSFFAAHVTAGTADGTATVANSGRIESDFIALGRYTSNLGTLIVTNSGTLEGATAFQGSDTVDKVTNTGKIIGAVTMNGGADWLDTHSGTIKGIIDLGAGKDTAYGSAAADTINGGADNDFIRGNGGKDTLDGGAGSGDGADYSDKTASVEVTLNGSKAVSVLVNGVVEDSIKNFENVNGSSAADKLSGDSLGNTLAGNGGKDLLSGNGGADTLVGGAKVDTMTGGADSDTFRFTAISDSGTSATTRDIITDFKVAQHDRISLADIDANTTSGAGGNQTFAFDTAKGTASKAVSTGHVAWYWEDNSGTANDHTIIKLNNDSDASVDMTIQLNGLITLHATDFVL